MRIVLLCATTRGLRVLDRLIALTPDDDLAVCSFPEEPVEPPFLEAIRDRARAGGARFYESRRVGDVDELWTGGVDLLLAVSWRYLLPRATYEQARRGAFVIHDSLLPSNRGFSPTVWAIANQEAWTGATLFFMGEEMDAGDIVDQRRVEIGGEDRIGEVMGRVTESYVDLLETNWADLRAGTPHRTPQDHARATYCRRRVPGDNEIDWTHSTERVYALIRAVTRPYAGAFSFLQGRKLTIWDARLVDGRDAPPAAPGAVVRSVPGKGTLVGTGDGMLLVTEVQLEGEPPRNAGEVLAGPSGALRLHRAIAAA